MKKAHLIAEVLRRLGFHKKQFSEKAAALMARRVRRFRKISSRSGGEHWGIFVTPWAESAFPHFSLEIALKLLAEGRKVTILYDATDLSINTHIRWAREAYYLGQLMEAVREVFPVIDLTDQLGEAVPREYPKLAEFARENFVCRFRGEEVAEKQLSRHPGLVEMLSQHSSVMRSALESGKFARLLIPGGFYGLSGLLAKHARRLGISYRTFDSSKGRVIYCRNGAAAWYEDCPEGFAAIHAAVRNDSERFEAVCGKARNEIEKRRTGRDDYRLQKAGLNSRLAEPWDVVAFLNIRCDIAALHRNRVFPDVRAWISVLSSWAAKRGVRLAVRQHPAESIEVVRGKDDLAALVREIDPGEKFVRFIPYDAPVNSYDLMEAAKVVLPFTSTTGLESAAAGKPVIVHTNCYYRGLDFVSAADSAEDYFRLIERALDGELAPTPDERKKALLCYAITQDLSWTFGKFTGIPDDFFVWSQLPVEKLWQQPDAQELWDFLQSDQPMSLVKFRRMPAAAAPQLAA